MIDHQEPYFVKAAAVDGLLRGLALFLAVFGIAGFVCGIWVEALTGDGPVPRPLDWDSWGSTAAGLALTLPGAVLAARLPRNPLCWLLVLCGASSTAAGLGAAYATYSLLEHAGGMPLTEVAIFIGARFGPIIHLAGVGMLVLFPDGRLPRGWMRPVAVLSLVCMGSGVLNVLVVPWEAFSNGETLSPALARYDLDLLTLPLPEAVWDSPFLPWMFKVVGTISLLTGLTVFAGRFRGADPQLRAQLRWMLLAAITFVSLMVGTMLLAVAFGEPQGPLSVLLEISFVFENAVITAAVIIGVTRHRLYDIDLLLGRTLLYGSLAAAVIGIDLAVFVAADALVEDRLAGVAAAGVVAVLYSPLRVRLQRMVNRILTGRADPYDLVSALARRLEESPGPEELLLETARSVATAFRSPYVRVELDRTDGTTIVVEQGSVRDDTVVLPFAYRDVPIGRLALVPRLGSRLSEGDQRLLADVVRQAAAAVRATALTEELQRSREDLVTGIAEERRRLRRDLHDGLGPELAAAGLKVQAARNLRHRDHAAADRTLEEVGADLVRVLADVRRLVHDLRPPALDQFGLQGAIEQQAGRFRGALNVTVGVNSDMAGLPAAVEVAVFRIVSEALNNVSRHAHATRCRVLLERDEQAVQLEIADDGRGVPAGALVGVGLVAMRERAEELGGRCLITAGPEGGTVVSASIPAMMTATPEQGAA